MQETLIRRPRRWRTAVMIVLGMAALAVFVARANYRARQTARTIVAIERLNGLVRGNALVRGLVGVKRTRISTLLGPPDDVYFQGPKAGDRELEVLSGLPELRVLNLSNTRVTDEGIARLARFPKLNDLCIANYDLIPPARPGTASIYTPPRWTGKGLAGLKSLPNLQSISVAGPQVTDADLPVLMSLKRLRMICLTQTSVTKEGVDVLRKALPNCKVIYR